MFPGNMNINTAAKDPSMLITLLMSGISIAKKYIFNGGFIPFNDDEAQKVCCNINFWKLLVCSTDKKGIEKDKFTSFWRKNYALKKLK